MDNDTLVQAAVEGVLFLFLIVTLFFMVWSANRMKEGRKRSLEHNARIEGLQTEANQLLRDILAQLRSRN